MAALKKVSLIDRIRGAFRAKDEALLEEALEMVGQDTQDPHHHITVNVNGAAVTDKKACDDDEEEKKEDKEDKEDKKDTSDAALKTIVDKLTGIETRLGAVETFVKDAKMTKDDDGDDDEDDKKKKTEDDDGDEEEKEDKKETKDSAMFVKSAQTITRVRAEWQDTLSRAEILMPGIRLPTFDAALGVKKIEDSMCAFRRRAVIAAFETDRGREAIKPYAGSDKPNFKAMTCDAMKILFIASSDKAKASNMRGAPSGFGAQRASGGLAKTAAEINAINAAFYGKK